MTDRIDQLEEGLAHALRALDDLSETIARQDREIALRVEMLLQREAAREAEGSGGVVFGDEKPPHY